MLAYFSFCHTPKILLRCFFLITSLGIAQNFEDIVLTQHVVDAANILSDEQELQLGNLLLDFENKTTHQVAVVTISSLQGLSIEEAAFTIFNTNKLGQEKEDNGVLILFAKNDRKVRIEVGYGLEDQLTDILCGKIIRQIMIPEFKKDNYATGIINGADVIVHHLGLSYNYQRVNDQTYQDVLKNDSSDSPLFLKIFMSVFLLPFLLAGVFIQTKNPLFRFSNFINIYTGENSVIGFIPQFLSGLFFIPFLAFIFLPFFFFGLVLEIDFEPYTEFFNRYILFFDQLMDSPFLRILGYLSPIWISLLMYIVVLPLIWVRFIKKKRIKLRFSLTPTEKSYFNKHGKYSRTYTTSGSSSSSGSSFSSSSSSFGGGGSSGGGGASGSW